MKFATIMALSTLLAGTAIASSECKRGKSTNLCYESLNKDLKRAARDIVYTHNSDRIGNFLRYNPGKTEADMDEDSQLLNEYFILWGCNDVTGKFGIKGECNQGVCQRGVWPFGKDKCVVSDDITVAARRDDVRRIKEKQAKKAAKEALARGRPVW